jgi:hypothetical protein
VSPSNNVHLEKDFPSLGQLDIGLSRINHLNQSGNGTIAVLNFQASMLNQGNLILSLNNILVVDNTGAEIPVTGIPDSLAILTGIADISSLKSFSIYPNPASNYLNIDFTSKENGKSEIQISDPEGRIIKTINTELKQGENHSKIETNDLNAGVYILKLKTQHDELTKRFVIIK